MSEIGQRLRQAREQKNLTLDELQRMTKIQKRYLAAIEEGRFDTLPGKFYARAFVKNYAEAVGIDPEVLFEELSDELPVIRNEATDTPPRMNRKSTRVAPKKSRMITLLPGILTSVFIIGILLGIWYFNQGDDTTEGQPRTSNENTDAEFNKDLPSVEEHQPETEPEVNPSTLPNEEQETTEPEESKQELTIIDTKGKKTFYELSNTDKFQVELKFTGNSYVGIANAKGNNFKEAMVYEGETLTYDFTAEEVIYFNIGATNNVTMTINEEPFEFPQEIVHQQLEIAFKTNSE